MLEECAKHLPCSGRNVEKPAEWHRPVLALFCVISVRAQKTKRERNCHQEKLQGETRSEM